MSTAAPSRNARITRRNAPRAAVVLAGALLRVAWAAAAPAAANTATFLYTGSQQQFVVPAGVTSVHVSAVGGRGGNGQWPAGGLGGAPAEVSADVPVLPGQTLYVEVGGPGTEASFAGNVQAFNGGSSGGQGGAGGGGASDVRLIARPEGDSPQSLFSRLIVAAGGGGGGAGFGLTLGGAGGNAGSAGSPASAGEAVGGGAGTQEAGGIGACANRRCNGAVGRGGGGAVGLPGSQGGGGGGGLFGGAGGDTNGVNSGAGGGGGSSLQPPGGNTVVPAVLGAPQVQISYTPPAPLITTGHPPSAASNDFALLRPIVVAGHSITLVLNLPQAGTVNATATATREVVLHRHGKRLRRRLRFSFGTARALVRAGALELKIIPSAAGRRALAAHRRVAVTVAVTFTPTGGKPATQRLNITLPRR